MQLVDFKEGELLLRRAEVPHTFVLYLLGEAAQRPVSEAEEERGVLSAPDLGWTFIGVTVDRYRSDVGKELLGDRLHLFEVRLALRAVVDGEQH